MTRVQSRALALLTLGVPVAKSASRFVCRSCGAVTPKWAGRCETCGEWNTVEEEIAIARPGPAAKAPAGRTVAFVGLSGSTEPPPRAAIGIAELDRVLGGGLVPASAVLVGGDPGIGKSTLLLQAAACLARSGRRVLYVTGEESIDQIRLRARTSGCSVFMPTKTRATGTPSPFSRREKPSTSSSSGKFRRPESASQ